MASRRHRKIYDYSIDEIYNVMHNSSIRYASKTTQNVIDRHRKRLEKELEKAVEKYVGNNDNHMHSKSKDKRTRVQYIKALVNGWLAEHVVVECILKKLYGQKYVKGNSQSHRIINHRLQDHSDCLVQPKSGEKYLVEVKTSVSPVGMANPRRRGADRVFVFKCNAASVLLREAKKQEARPMVTWYVAETGRFYLMGPNEFLAMTKTKPITRKTWDKECYLFEIPPDSNWREVKDLWTRT